MGRIIVIGIFVAASLMGGMVYWTFKHHESFVSEVTGKMKTHFYSYVSEVEKKSTLAIQGSPYLVDLKGGWSFEVHDKTLFAIAPNLQSVDSNTPSLESVELARKQVTAFVSHWLQTEFKKENEFDVLVKFRNEITPGSSSLEL